MRYKKKITQSQTRILDMLQDKEQHPLLIELEEAGYYNQFPAIRALEDKGLIIVTIPEGYYSRWALSEKVK